jgi:protein CpxP
MKTLKKFLLLTTLCTAMLPAFAQRQAPKQNPNASEQQAKREAKHQEHAKLSPEERAQKMTDKMVKTLQLNEQQAAKVAEINLKNATTIAQIKDSELSRYEKFQKMEAMEQQVSAQLRQVLNDEQFKKVEAIKAQRAEKRDDKLSERLDDRKPAEERATQRTMRMTKVLNLDDKQVALVKELNLKHAQAVESILKTAPAQKGDRLKQLDAQEKQYESSLQKVLSPEQYQKAQALKSERRDDRF